MRILGYAGFANFANLGFVKLQICCEYFYFAYGIRVGFANANPGIRRICKNQNLRILGFAYANPRIHIEICIIANPIANSEFEIGFTEMKMLGFVIRICISANPISKPGFTIRFASRDSQTRNLGFAEFAFYQAQDQRESMGFAKLGFACESN